MACGRKLRAAMYSCPSPRTRDSRLGTPDSRLQTPQVGFAVAAYDPSKPLVIDPGLSYSTYLGGSSSDEGVGIAVDTAGNASVTGWTGSTDFPTAHPLQPALRGPSDAFVAQLNATGSALVYSTYLGGSGDENFDVGLSGGGIAVDPAGNASVTGVTTSPDFPTAHPLQPAYGGGPEDFFVEQLTTSCSAVVFSPFLGGSGDDHGLGVAVDTA